MKNCDGIKLKIILKPKIKYRNYNKIFSLYGIESNHSYECSTLKIAHSIKQITTLDKGSFYAWCLGIQFSSVAQLCLTVCDLMDRGMPGLPVHHQLQEFTQTHLHWVSDAIQPSHPLSSPSPFAFSLSQHQGLFKWVSTSHEVAKVLDLQLHHQSFQWTPRTDFL